ncbi:hypothetical protein GDO81_000414 [Engystomops pustulosus]|uniref:BHLH domain-containing protein n=1 Tax=Engystomops pustulosus TaxID=76066 RepID=A0AAV7D642_ENGPU|nr:hypothetical protein GDO81_000414 [Engystomops pustulosus]
MDFMRAPPEPRSAQRTPVSHKVIERGKRTNHRCLSELGKTVPMALAKQNSGKLEKAEILEMTVQYLRAREDETKDHQYARIVAFLQSKAHLTTEPLFSSLQEVDMSCQLHSSPPDYPSPGDSTYTQSPPHHHASAIYATPAVSTYWLLTPMQSLDRHYLNLRDIPMPIASACTVPSTLLSCDP